MSINVPFPAEDVAILSAIIKEYVDGNIQRADAFFQLFTAVHNICGAHDVASSPAILQPWVEQLDAHDAERRAAKERGQGNGGGEGEGEGEGDEGEEGNNAGKRGLGDVDGDDQPPRKRQKLVLPWETEADSLIATILSAKVRAVVDRVHAASPLAPGFPRNLWKAVLLDEYVDFDAILTSTYAVEADESDQFVVGEDVDNGSPPFGLGTRPLSSPSPSVAPNSKHWRVINYDRAARVHICRTKALLSNNGVRVNAPQPNGNRKLPGKSPAKARRAPPDGQQREYDANEVCRRYNRNECTRGTTCRFRHACSGCDGDGHAANDCPDKQRR